MAQGRDDPPARRRILFDPSGASASAAVPFTPHTTAQLPMVKPPAPSVASGQANDDPQRNFRFFDNRQKYLLFVNTCSEKWEVANRVSLELANIHPRPPAVRVFDAGVGDGTVLARVMRSMHDRFPTMPFYVVGKEISLEDVRLTLQKLPDRFVEHPSTVVVLTNLAYAEAPWLAVKSLSAATSLIWKEVAMDGTTAPFLRAADHGAGAVPRRELEGARLRQERQSGLRAAGGPGALPQRPQIPARPDHSEAGRHHRRLRSGHRVAAVIAPAPRSISRPSACWRRSPARSARAAG